jgi:type IV secretory pathway TrbD component
MTTHHYRRPVRRLVTRPLVVEVRERRPTDLAMRVTAAAVVVVLAVIYAAVAAAAIWLITSYPLTYHPPTITPIDTQEITQ